MEIITSLDQVTKSCEPCVIALGTFDGLHKGHVDVIKAAAAYAKRHNLKLGVFTFSNHPYTYIRPGAVPVALISFQEKIERLIGLGVDILLDIPFDEVLANLTAESFLEILQGFNYRCLVVGENFSYGYMGLGNTDSLRLKGQQEGFEVIVRPLLQQDNRVISSTSIRNLIQNGKLDFAAKMLGRTYTVLGKVEHGFQRGRAIGFPTANLYLDRSQLALPPSGTYAVTVKTGWRTYRGMANLGKNPTFDDVKGEVLEVNLFDFKGDLYDHQLVVGFKKFLRGEQKFASLEALKEQIAKDKQATLSYFESTAKAKQ